MGIEMAMIISHNPCRLAPIAYRQTDVGRDRGAYGVIGQAGRVVLLGQMTEGQMLDAQMAGVLCHLSAIPVGQMPHRGEDPGFQIGGIGPRFQHIDVVIGLDQRSAASRHGRKKRLTDVPHIRGDADRIA